MTYGRKEALAPDGTKKGWENVDGRNMGRGTDGSNGSLLDGRKRPRERGRRVLDWRKDGRVLE